jgi:pyridoxine 5-phosphate synthase
VAAGEVTSQAGWAPDTSAAIRAAVARLQSGGIRVSLFVDPTVEAVRWAAEAGADRIELYTEPFAKAFARGPDSARACFERYASAARLAHDLGLGVNAGHDLDLENLPLFRTLPHLAEVSIGHALVSRALWVGLDRAVREYLAAVAGV